MSAHKKSTKKNKTFNSVVKVLRNDMTVREYLISEVQTTSDKLTTAEKTRLISERAKQIDETNETYIPNIADYKVDSSAEIAELEIELHLCPLLIVRSISNSQVVEIIDPNKMIN